MQQGAICGVTFTVPSLAPIEHAYTRYLHMRVRSRGQVGASAAASWGTPPIATCPMLTLVPEIGEQTFLRFIEDPEAGVCPAFTTHGWNAAELTVRDTDALAATLAESPFTIIGPPRNLTGFEWIRAMQVLGPAGECLYLTDVGADPGLAAPRCRVGQVFIAVVGGPDLAALAEFHGTRFGNAVSAPVSVPIGVLNRANRLPADRRHGLALVTLPDGTRVELDHFPETTRPRLCLAGHLPPGMSMVSFQAATGEATQVGPAGEYVERLAAPWAASEEQ